MKQFRFLTMGAAIGCLATGAQAETLRIVGVDPAWSDEAIEVETISVEQFAGADGPRLSYLIEDRLRGVRIEGEQWFTVLVPQLANEADGVLNGYVEPRFSESRFRGTRNVCWRTDAQNNCIERRDVETDCVRVAISMEPEMRLASLDGRLLWASDMRRSTEVSFCQEFDEKPDFEPIIARWLDELANNVRGNLAPQSSARDIRIMEGRRGLQGDARRLFRDAVRMTHTDERAACDMFDSLLADNPAQDSLVFNTGLCAEQAGDFALAADRYQLALSSDRSDDEAQAGLHRLGQRARADRQLEQRAMMMEQRWGQSQMTDRRR